tara:strand:- start:3113 stop:3388 length:276 start_codon:yes stop_codon:yes gene_type:complete
VQKQPPNWQISILRALRQANYYGWRKIKPGLRTLAGILLIIGGMFGFLPILGFWMIPVGLLLIALDIPVLRRSIQHWLLKLKQKLHHGGSY